MENTGSLIEENAGHFKKGLNYFLFTWTGESMNQNRGDWRESDRKPGKERSNALPRREGPVEKGSRNNASSPLLCSSLIIDSYIPDPGPLFTE